MTPDHTQHGAQKNAAPKDDKATPNDKMAAPGATMEHEGAKWPHFANMTLGLWLVTGVFALEYRSASLQVSDTVSGALIIVLAILSLSGSGGLKFWSP